VQWKGYNERTWEPISNLLACERAVREFEAMSEEERQTRRHV
jgi:hypothetical protein